MPATRNIDDIDEDDDIAAPSPSDRGGNGSAAAAGGACAPNPPPAPPIPGTGSAFDDFFGAPAHKPAVSAVNTSGDVNDGGAPARPLADALDALFRPNTNNTGSSPNSSSNAGRKVTDDFLDFNAPSAANNRTRHADDPNFFIHDLERASKGLSTVRQEQRQEAALASGGARGSGGAGGPSTATVLGNSVVLARMTHYEVLGLRELSDDREATARAYKRKALELHPDRHRGGRGGGPGQTSEEQAYFKAVVRANEVLCDPEEKALYDATLVAYRQEGGVGAPPLPTQAPPPPPPPDFGFGSQQPQPQQHQPPLSGSSSSGGLGGRGSGSHMFVGRDAANVDDLFS